MSRIGRMPVKIPAGVQIQIEGTTVKVKGPKGEMARTFPAFLAIHKEADSLQVKRSSDARIERASHGMARALIQNMVTGVSVGFQKELQVEGVGYRAEIKGSDLVLNLGFSHPVTVKPPAGISFGVDEKARTIQIRGFDREQVGQLAADLRKIRPPEPYKGKGLRYVGERVRRKAGKAGKTAAAGK
ncbi:MAG: 50S ribosomal protein L6 [Anaerolineales bacterium]|nr:50S ribosomal protein L6 [Anaerolineales bacterium]